MRTLLYQNATQVIEPYNVTIGAAVAVSAFPPVMRSHVACLVAARAMNAPVRLHAHPKGLPIAQRHMKPMPLP